MQVCRVTRHCTNNTETSQFECNFNELMHIVGDSSSSNDLILDRYFKSGAQSSLHGNRTSHPRWSIMMLGSLFNNVAVLGHTGVFL